MTYGACWLLLLVLTVTIAACGGGGTLRDEPLSTVTITLDRGPCFGFCPDYSVTVKGDGSVTYEGRNFVATSGRVTAQIPQGEVERLVAAFDDAHFFELEDDYTVSATDLPTVITTLSIGGRTKSVRHYGVGCDVEDLAMDTAPDELCELEALIDEVANTERWVGVRE